MRSISEAAHLAGLEAKFEEHFTCMVGPPRAYVEFKRSSEQQSPYRLVYQTFVVVTDKPPGDEAYSALISYMWDKIFQPVVDELRRLDPERFVEDDNLVWRLKPYFESLPGGGTGLRFRLAIAGIRVPGEHPPGSEDYRKAAA